MKTTKLVVGILMIVLSVFIFIQGSITNLGNAIFDNESSTGSAGIGIAFIMLTTGIIYIVTRNKTKLFSDAINFTLLTLGAIFGFSSYDGTYPDLIIWATLSILIGVGFLVWHIFLNKHNLKIEV